MVVISLSNSVSKLIVDIVKDSLIYEEAKRKEDGESSSSFDAYVSEKQEMHRITSH